MDTKEAIQKLEQAKSVIEIEGWCQGSYTNYQGHHCVVGALRVVDWDNQDELVQLLRQNLSNPNRGVVEWNDQSTRRKRDVIRLYNRTIRNLAAKL